MVGEAPWICCACFINNVVVRRRYLPPSIPCYSWDLTIRNVHADVSS